MSVIESALRRAEQEAAAEPESIQQAEPAEQATSGGNRSWFLIGAAIVAFVGVYAALELNSVPQLPVASMATSVHQPPTQALQSMPALARSPVATTQSSEAPDAKPATAAATATEHSTSPSETDPSSQPKPAPNETAPTPASVIAHEAVTFPPEQATAQKPLPKTPAKAQEPQSPNSLPEVHAEALTGKNTPSVADKYRLECVMISGASRMAVVNGTLVRVGQVVDGAKVTSIRSRHVVLSVDGVEHRIPLRAEES